MDKKSSMNSPKGVYSYSKNPMAAPKRTSAMAGPGSNSDQSKVNKLLQQAQKKEDSLRGKSGM
jgi:hypothetical protein